jgi:tetraacyldisaccharide 4'-kinase
VPHPFADHHPYAAPDLDFGDGLPVVMTEKDAVKCRRFARSHFWMLPVTAEIDPAFGALLTRKLGGPKAA